MKNSVNQGIIDVEAIEKLKVLQRPGRPDLLTALIELYLETSSESLQEIRTAIQNNNLALLVSAAHSLKSSSANLGASELSRLCLQLENMTELNLNTEESKNTFDTLEKEIFQVWEELKRFKIAA